MIEKKIVRFGLVIIALLLFTQSNAQYFGKNKVKYNKIKFDVVKSKSFDMYHYTKNDSLSIALIKDAEKWRVRHAQVLTDTFAYKIPLIFYNNHGDFQQSNVVSGLIGTSTGGVTEGLKSRVIMPLTFSYGQTDHVLGHELVHTHQYNMIKANDSLSFQNMGNIPLWMTEGMAEYLSIGSEDSHTALWMRDAVLHDYFPSIKDLNSGKFFPYRYGQSFWAFIGGTFGDDKIYPLYQNTAMYGLKEAFKRTLGMPLDSVSKKWQTTSKKYYKQFLDGRIKKPLGKKMIDYREGGHMNVSPSFSPDGKYFIFLSERNLFSMDLYLAASSTGKIIRRISTNARKSHLDDLDAFNSSGTWSPDSKKYAFIIYSKGMNKIIINDLEKNKITTELFVKDVPSIAGLHWSPNGKTILFSGLKRGQSDLYTIDVKTEEVTQITNDFFAQMQPMWSPDGSKIIFVSDKKSNLKISKKLTFSILDVATKKIVTPQVFKGVNNMNPIFDKTGENVLFISDRDGFRDIYKYNLETKKVWQLTNYFTGISGITKYSPAISYSTKLDELLFTVYNNSKYGIYRLNLNDFDKKLVQLDDVSNEPAMLPSMNLKESFVNANLKEEKLDVATGKLTKEAYKPKFKLDYISNGGVGVSSGRYGVGMQGGVNMLFGDILGENQLFAGVVLNGELEDFGAQAAYINRKNRFAWGGGLSHIPYRYVFNELAYDVIDINNTPTNVIRQTYHIYRIFNDKASVFSFYPFSKNTRLEGSTSFNRYSYSLTDYNNYYDTTGRYFYRQDRNKGLPTRDPISFGEGSLAYVGDKTSFGMTAPMKGYRYRFEVQQTFGGLNTTALLTDFRKYVYTKPVTFAFKAYHYSKYGRDADNQLSVPLYLGYGTLVRGYTFSAFNNASSSSTFTPNDLIGNRIIVSNFEVRFPFTGPKRLALIDSGYIMSDLNLFVDAGVAWGQNRRYGVDRKLNEAKIITSTGLSLRINLFGQLIIEPYYAFPLQLKGNSGGVFGINFTPGW